MPHRATSDRFRLQMHISCAFPDCIGLAAYRWERHCYVNLVHFSNVDGGPMSV